MQQNPAERDPTDSAEAIPWLAFLLLTTVFFLAQHEWDFSLSLVGENASSVEPIIMKLETGSSLRRIGLLMLGMFGALTLLRFPSGRIAIDRYYGWLLLFTLFWTGISLTWSAEPTLTVKRLLALWVLCLGALAVSLRFTPRNIVLWISFSTLIYLCIGIAAEIALGTFHPLSGEYRFAGTLHPNSQGINCALLLIAAVFLARSHDRRRRYLWYILAVAALAFLILTKSRTSIFFAVGAIYAYWLLTLPFLRRWFSGLITTAFVILFSLVLFNATISIPGFGRILSFGRPDADAITLTGRIPLWAELSRYIVERPFSGYGYDAFWTSHHISEISDALGFPVIQSHSAYLDVLLSVGIIGFAAFLLTGIGGLSRALRAHSTSQNRCYGFFGVVLIFAGLNGLTESLVVAHSFLGFLCMTVVTTFGFPKKDGDASR